MCGIGGSFNFGPAAGPVDISYLRRLRETMSHRGPDGSGEWLSEDSTIGLCHQRLSIIDLSESAGQPMSDASGTLTISFNGEIYNHAELRTELEKLGYTRWNTDHSDTEVVLNAFLEWGIDCLARFRGMFAFALWDSRVDELWLVRDRIGVKPLYYATLPGRIIFASEIKGLLADPEIPRRVDHESLFHFLTFLTTPAPHTLFGGINKLKPGHWLRVARDGSIKEQRYWDVWDHTEPLTNASDAEIAERLLGCLDDSVRLRKTSDRPVGIFLSGGIDSGTNAALFSRGESDQIKTFTVGYRGHNPSYKDETSEARSLAEFTGAIHHEVILDRDDVLSFLPDMVRYQDEPIADSVCVPLYFVSKRAREAGVVVCQVGEGADELFHGYDSWRTGRRAQRINDLLPGAPARWLAAAVLAHVPGIRDDSADFARRGARGQPLFWSGVNLFTEAQKNRMLGESVRRSTSGLTSFDAVEPAWNRFLSSAWDTGVMNWMSYADLSLRLPELLLMRVDKMSMAVSLECRVPFLDHEFVTLAMSIPGDVKLRDGVSKAILKRAVRGVIPDETIDRKKKGFGMPVDDWIGWILANGGRSAVDTFCMESGLLDPHAVRELMDGGDASRVWAILNLALWWHEYFGDSARSALKQGISAA